MFLLSALQSQFAQGGQNTVNFAFFSKFKALERTAVQILYLPKRTWSRKPIENCMLPGFWFFFVFSNPFSVALEKILINVIQSCYIVTIYLNMLAIPCKCYTHISWQQRWGLRKLILSHEICSADKRKSIAASDDTQEIQSSDTSSWNMNQHVGRKGYADHNDESEICQLLFFITK